MSELKRNTDFAASRSSAAGPPNPAHIGESRSWRTDLQRAMDNWALSAAAGFDPYNHVGARAKKPHVD
jgi:hypothetical protein